MSRSKWNSRPRSTKRIPATWITTQLTGVNNAHHQTPQSPTPPATQASKNLSPISPSPRIWAAGQYIHLLSRRNPNAKRCSPPISPHKSRFKREKRRQWLARGGGSELPVIRPNNILIIFKFSHSFYSYEDVYLLNGAKRGDQTGNHGSKWMDQGSVGYLRSMIRVVNGWRLSLAAVHVAADLRAKEIRSEKVSKI